MTLCDFCNREAEIPPTPHRPRCPDHGGSEPRAPNDRRIRSAPPHVARAPLLSDGASPGVSGDGVNVNDNERAALESAMTNWIESAMWRSKSAEAINRGHAGADVYLQRAEAAAARARADEIAARLAS